LKVLDQGYVKLIESWGSDERVIESARMSTSGAFKGWGYLKCTGCGVQLQEGYGSTRHDDFNPQGVMCYGNAERVEGDEKLLAYLWRNKHTTPFEMAGATFELKLPIVVIREWHRHRTQSYSEMSARYVPLPDENYMPTMERIKLGLATASGNRQAQGTVEFNEQMAEAWLDHLQRVYMHAQSIYQMGINAGVPKELARLCVPVARYSCMRATANLRNWLAFLTLRQAPGAQWEIRQFADAVALNLSQSFPRTMALFNEKP